LLMGRRCAIAAAISLSFLAGCAAPPGVTLPFEGAHRAAVGTHSVGGAASYTGDVWNLPGAHVDVRYGHQVARDVAVTGDLVGAAVSESRTVVGAPVSRTSAGLAGGRVGVRINPATDYLAFTLGVAGGAMFAERADPTPYVTGDFGVRAGVRFASDRLELVGAQSMSFTGVWFRNTDGGWVGFSSTELGINVFATRALSVGGFVSMLYAFGKDNRADRPFFVPSLAINYRLGL
jgi:hypothetical protein